MLKFPRERPWNTTLILGYSEQRLILSDLGEITTYVKNYERAHGVALRHFNMAYKRPKQNTLL